MKKYVRNCMIVSALSPLIAYFVNFIAACLLILLNNLFQNTGMVLGLYNIAGETMVLTWTLAVNVTVMIYLLHRMHEEKNVPKGNETTDID